MTKFSTIRLLTLFVVLFMGGKAHLNAQCINTVSFGAATIDSTAASPIVIDLCNQANHYAEVSVLSSGVYTFTSSITADHITLTDENNTVIEHGPQPLSVILETPGNYRMHITADANCATNSTCRETEVVYISSLPSLNYNTVAPVYDYGMANMAGFNASPSNTFYRNSFIVTQSELQQANLQAGSPVKGLGFQLWYSAPSPDTIEVAVKIYLENTVDTTYQKGTTWTNILTSMEPVLSDTIVIILTQGRQNLYYPFDTVFNYTGNGVYVSTEYKVINQTLANNQWVMYYTNNGLSNGFAFGYSVQTIPGTLQIQGPRPVTLWGLPRVADDLEIVHAFALGTNMWQNGYPEQMEVRVRNNGFLPADKPVTLSISGANTYTSSQNVQLPSGEDTVLFFAGFIPTNLGFNAISTSVPADMVPGNNSSQCIQQTTTNRMGHIDTNLTGVLSTGVHQGGLLVNKHFVNGTNEVTAVRVRIGLNVNSIGEAVYAVVLDSAENIVAQSDTMIISASDMETFVTLPINTPPTFTDESFYVGMAQIVNGTQYYSPFSLIRKRPQRSNVFFQRTFQESALRPVGIDGWTVMEAVFDTIDCPAPTSLYADEYCDSIVVSWNSSSQTIGTTIEYGPTGFVPGSGTIITGAQSPHILHGISVGTYDIRVVDTCENTNMLTVATVTVTVDPAHADFTYTHTSVGNVFFDASASLNTNTFVWDFGDGNSGVGQTINHTYFANGTYDVRLVVDNNCDEDTLVKSVLIEGISTTSYTLESVQIYPNPSRGIFHINNLPDDAHCTLVVTDTRGSLVYAKEGNKAFTIDLSSMAEGIYFITLSSPNGRLTRKVIVAK